MDLKNIRRNYKKSKIDFANIDKDPFVFFLRWLDEALEVDKEEANACILSTVSSDSKPSSRVVLLKEVRDNGFVFYTNYHSKKAVDIAKNNHVALNFYWPVLERQVRIEGAAERISEKDSDLYFKNRPRESQLSAWLSNQSFEIDMNFNVQESMNKLNDRFQDKKVHRPLHWGGYYISPNKIEFWQGRPSRFHDRVLYEFYQEKWNRRRLFP